MTQKILLLAVAVLVISALLIPIPYSGRTATALGDLVHAPLFGAITLAALIVVQQSRPIRNSTLRLTARCVAVGFVIVCFGGAMELIQGMMGRNPAMHDLVANALGVIAAVLFYLGTVSSIGAKTARWKHRGLVFLAGVVWAIAWYPPMVTLLDVAQMRLAFPQLADFESRFELQRLRLRECEVGRSTRGATEGRRALEMSFPPFGTSAVAIMHLVRDWSSMEALEFDVELDAGYPNDSLALRVLSASNETGIPDRFVEIVELTPGEPKHVVIEREQFESQTQSGQFDFSHVRFVAFQFVEPQHPAIVYFDNIRLRLDDR